MSVIRQAANAVPNLVLAASCLLLLCVGCVVPAADKTPTFYLCETNLERVSPWPPAPAKLDRIELKLDEIGARSFESFTRDHVGQPVRLLVGSLEVLRTEVRNTIVGGRISIRPPDGFDEIFLDAIEAAPAAPCGPAV